MGNDGASLFDAAGSFGGFKGFPGFVQVFYNPLAFYFCGYAGHGFCNVVYLCHYLHQYIICTVAIVVLLAAKAGATFISPFVGRLDDNGADGMMLIREIRQIYDNYDFSTEILAASLRTPLHVKEAALAGADCATLPPSTFKALYKHNLTDAGLATFLKDWAASGQSIL